MELIPILSTIILVATISTFMLAVGAYILYKVRERKGSQASAQQPAEVKAELITPASAPSQLPQPSERGMPQPGSQRQPIFIQQRAGQPQQRFTPVAQPFAGFTNQARQYQGTEYTQQRGYESRGLTEEEKKNIDSRFMKYTSEGYVPAKEDKPSGALKWR